MKPIFITAEIASKESLPDDGLDYEALGIDRPKPDLSPEDIVYKEVEINICNISRIEDHGPASPIINLYMNSGNALSAKLTVEEIKQAIDNA